MTRLLCTGDWHIGAHPEYGRAPGDRLAAQEKVFDQIVDLAIEQNVDIFLHTGDVFDGPIVHPEHLAAFRRPLARLRDVGIPVVVTSGNGRHDQAMRSENALAIFGDFSGITVASAPRLVEVGDATIACLPWVSPARLVAAENGETDRDQVNQRAAELLVATARGLRAQIPDGRSAVLALHGSVSGTSLPSGLPVDDLREPVLDAGDLEACGFDYIVAGHIHRAQEIGRSGFYVGSPLPLNFGEDPDPYAHGAWILDTAEPEIVDAKGAEFVPLDSPRFVTVAFDFTKADAVTMLDLFIPEIPDAAIVRARYRATADQARHFDVGLLRRELHAAGAAVVKIQPDIVRTDRARVDGVTEDLSPLAAFELWLEHEDVDTGCSDRLRARAALLFEAVT